MTSLLRRFTPRPSSAAILVASLGLSLSGPDSGAQLALETTISGTHTPNVGQFGNYRPFALDPGTTFMFADGPILVTGRVDISLLQGNSSTFVGLISTDQYDRWVNSGITGANDPGDSMNGFFGFLDTAYAAFNTAQDGRLGLGQQLSFGSTTQTYVANDVGTEFVDFEILFWANRMELTYDGNTVVQSYQDGFDYINWFNAGDVFANANAANYPVPTDFSSGAIPFVGTFFAEPGTADFDVTFTQVPEPTRAVLLALGLLGLMARRRR